MNGESRGFAFVTFAHASCAAGAMANMAGAVLPGVFQDRPLNVAPSTRDQQAQVQPTGNPLARSC
jgi:RNA recognition motif-containing protein